MGANAATKCKRVIDNVEKVLAIELITAVQALHFRRPLKSSPLIEQMIAQFQQVIPFNDADRILHYDMIKAIDFIKSHPL